MRKVIDAGLPLWSFAGMDIGCRRLSAKSISRPPLDVAVSNHRGETTSEVRIRGFLWHGLIRKKKKESRTQTTREDDSRELDDDGEFVRFGGSGHDVFHSRRADTK